VRDLTTQLQAALGDAYRIERELGGGGMSHVFLAEETRLGRKVVIKVLPPQMAAGVSADRFEREILLAAGLQHPHVVPLLTAGAAGDLLYYVMPFIEGESLRAKLAREGEMPVDEVARVLKDVLEALSYAHEQGIVHRDIKPDNVMLTRGHALVTDFGVAKAVASSTGQTALTSLGVALGTPAYMSPEQAAAEPNVDHRADLYAVGAMAYEMLTGRPPFAGPTLQSVLSAHVLDTPEPVTRHRETVPPALAAMVMRCLAKKPADRPQRAAELVAALDAMLTPSGGTTPTGTAPAPSADYEARARHAHPLRVGVLFALSAAAVLGIVYGVMLALGLPNWVFFAAVALMIAGLPVVLLTGQQERKRAMARAEGVPTTTPTGVKAFFTWRRALTGGGAAFGVLAVLVGGFMTLRTLGIGPFGTLVSSGKLAEQAKILVPDFTNRTSDSTLGATLGEALRIDLSQSPVVHVLGSQEIAVVLARMERPESTRVTADLAREIAAREGIPAIIVGEVTSLGSGYVLSTKVVAGGDGAELAAVRESAADAGGLLSALDRLAASVRERIGESYRSLRASKPLAQVTTSSLDALRLYTRGVQADRAADFGQAVELLHQAIALDTAFASAYLSLGTVLSNTYDAGAVEATAAAFRHRDRLPPLERYLAEARYYNSVEYDLPRVIAAYRGALSIDPEQGFALNNLANAYFTLRQYVQAESVYQRALIANDSATWQNYANLMYVRLALGKIDEARQTMAAFHRRMPDNRIGLAGDAELAFAAGDYDSTIAIAHTIASRARGTAVWERYAVTMMTASLRVLGRLAEARAASEARQRIDADGNLDQLLRFAMGDALAEIEVAGRLDRGARLLDSALARAPLDSIALHDRPYAALITGYAEAGRADRARDLLARWERDVPAVQRTGWDYESARGMVALVEHHPEDARLYLQRAADKRDCNRCLSYLLGRAWEESGQPDSALAAYERYLDALDGERPEYENGTRAGVLLRAGQLAQQLGHREDALARLGGFVELWQHADPDLQPIVEDVKARLARLTAEGG
jgi:tetratricopeptide (TPR) repeat protein